MMRRSEAANEHAQTTRKQFKLIVTVKTREDPWLQKRHPFIVPFKVKIIFKTKKIVL